MARPHSKGPIEIAIREPNRTLAIAACEDLGGVSVTQLVAVVLEDVATREGLTSRYADALKRRGKAARKTA